MKLVGADEQIMMYHVDSLHWLAETNLLEMLLERLGSQVGKMGRDVGGREGVQGGLGEI